MIFFSTGAGQIDILIKISLNIIIDNLIFPSNCYITSYKKYFNLIEHIMTSMVKDKPWENDFNWDFF